MTARSYMYNDPEMEIFVRATGPTLGWGTKGQFGEFMKRWPAVDTTLDKFRFFALRIKKGGHVVPREDDKSVEITVDEVIKRHREELERRAKEKLLKDLMAKQSRTQQLLETVEEALHAIPPKKFTPWAPPKAKSDTPQDAIVLLSDVHAGQVVFPEEIGGMNAYNHEIFLRRFEDFERGTYEIIRHQQSAFPVETMSVLSLGDLIEGDGIFKSQRLFVDRDLMKQVFETAQRVAEFLVRSLQVVKTVNVHAVPGNHGRIHSKGEDKTYVNWDYVVMKTVELYCKEYADRIHFNIPESFFIITEIGGHNWLLYHGDDVKSWAGIPWYGIQRAIGEWIQIFNTMGKTFQYAAQGHFHREAKIDVAAGEVFINGNWVGTNEHSLHMRAVGLPKQLLLFSHPQYGVTSRHPIFLEQPWA